MHIKRRLHHNFAICIIHGNSVHGLMDAQHTNARIPCVQRDEEYTIDRSQHNFSVQHPPVLRVVQREQGADDVQSASPVSNTDKFGMEMPHFLWVALSFPSSPALPHQLPPLSTLNWIIPAAAEFSPAFVTQFCSDFPSHHRSTLLLCFPKFFPCPSGPKCALPATGPGTQTSPFQAPEITCPGTTCCSPHSPPVFILLCHWPYCPLRSQYSCPFPDMDTLLIC